jgi:polysaccharide pyruvyl transferase WcaK-like protein
MRAGERSGVLLSGYFGCGNLGDDLLLATAVAHLRPLFPDAPLLVRDSGDVAHLRALDAKLEFTGIDVILADQRRSRARRLAAYLVRLAEALDRCQWLIFAGGTVFHEHANARSLFIQWSICRLARLLGVRIAAIGVGVAELHSRRARWLLHDIVGMSELFLVRDEGALAQCAGTSAQLTGDLAFAWPALAPPARGAAVTPDAGGRRTIALTVCPSAFMDAGAKHATAAFSEAVRGWRERGHRVVFLVFHRGEATRDDRAMFNRIAALAGGGKSIETRVPAATPEAIATAYRDVDLVFGMRFHGLVLAAQFGVPFVGVAHENKISEICRRFDMPCFNADSLEGAALGDATDAALRRVPDPRLVALSMAGAEANFRALAAAAR